MKKEVFWLRWWDGVCVWSWIHFNAGDTSRHNNLVGHMNGGQPTFVYRDCRCLFDDLSSPVPTCSLITSEELKQACLTEDGLTNLCKKTISNAFENVPLDDPKYGYLFLQKCYMSVALAYSNTCLVVMIIWSEAPIWNKKIRNHLMIYTVV